MGDLIKSALTDEIKAGLGRKNLTLDDITPAEYVRALNLAQSRLTRKHSWRPLLRYLPFQTKVITGVPNTDRFLDPTPFLGGDVMDDVAALRVLENSGTYMRKLKRWPFRHYQQLIDNVLFTGTTFAYVWPAKVAGNLDSFILYYVPHSNYQFDLQYYKKPTQFTTGADVASDFDAELDEALIAYGSYYLMRRTTRYEDANHFLADGDAIVDDAMASDIAEVDIAMLPEGISEGGAGISEYWRDPFVKRTP